MNDMPPTDRWSLPLERDQHLSQVCDAFESAWRAGQRPRIVDHCKDVAEPDRSALLCELLRLELAYRHQVGERPAAAEYQALFPEHAALVSTVFQEAPTIGWPTDKPEGG